MAILIFSTSSAISSIYFLVAESGKLHFKAVVTSHNFIDKHNTFKLATFQTGCSSPHALLPGTCGGSRVGGGVLSPEM